MKTLSCVSWTMLFRGSGTLERRIPLAATAAEATGGAVLRGPGEFEWIVECFWRRLAAGRALSACSS
jgi:hypothetical protein